MFETAEFRYNQWVRDEGYLVYHLTTFFEKGGMVTVFAFDQPVKLTEGHGWWGNVYWRVVKSRDGKPLVMVAQKKHALSVGQTTFSQVLPAQSSASTSAVVFR